ncbi:MAG: hypothetical protein HZA89_08000 [Verrucomicrobia bacterium]|nr:hypothetical protein [Verrucomicrobiota bacterium]
MSASQQTITSGLQKHGGRFTFAGRVLFCLALLVFAQVGHGQYADGPLKAFPQPVWPNGTGSVQLRATILPTNALASVWFEWGEGTNLANRTAGWNPNGTQPLLMNQNISGLIPRRSYFYRVAASNSVGTVFRLNALPIPLGKVVGWGSYMPNVPSNQTSVVNVAANIIGPPSAAVLTDNRTVLAFGDNSSGQTNVPAGLINSVALASGVSYFLALRANGWVEQWGQGVAQMPTTLSNQGVMAISAGDVHYLALRTNGTVLIRGSPAGGGTNVPTELSNVVAIATSYKHYLALRNDGTVLAWGDNYYGQTNVPTGLKDVVAVSAGGHHSLALRNDGTVVAWGDNYYGQTNVPTGLSNVVAIAGGWETSLALRAGGTVVVWGDNNYNQTNVPGSVSNVSALSAGSTFTMAVVQNRPPSATPQTNNGGPNIDLTITLNGTDADGDALGFRITALPAVGSLYQYNNGSRGTAITATNNVVSDANGQLIFAPAPDSGGTSYDSFQFVANDGVDDSAPATVTINISKLTQTITFDPLTNRAYGDAPFALNAAASSGLPVALTVVSGPATVSNNLATLTGAGAVMIRAAQTGSALYDAAPDVEQSFTVSNAVLVATPSNATRLYAATNPPLTGTLAGVVNGDGITASFSTTATTASPPGDYPITVALNDPDSRLDNYSVTLNQGTLTVLPDYSLLKLNIWLINGKVELDWDAVGFPSVLLQSGTDLFSGDWQEVSGTIAVTNGRARCLIPMENERYFRLRQP